MWAEPTMLGIWNFRVYIDGDEGFLPSNVLEQLISGTFPVNIWPLFDAIAQSEGDEEEEALPTS